MIVLKGHKFHRAVGPLFPDGTLVVTASSDGTARIWNTATGAEVGKLLQKGNIISALFSPDGSQIATVSEYNGLRIWDMASRSEIAAPSGHQDRVQYAAFSTDGSRIVTGSWDRTARVWDAATGVEIGILTGHKGAVYAASMSVDGARAVTGSLDGTARIWNLSRLENGEAFAVARARLGNNTELTELRGRYSLGEIAPICGDHPPSPIEQEKLR